MSHIKATTKYLDVGDLLERRKKKNQQHCEYSSHISIQISWCEEKTSEPKKQSVRINSLQTPEYVYWRGHIFVRIIHIIV